MHLTASLHPTPMRKLSACAKRGGRCHLSRPKGIDSDAYHSSSRRFESAAFALAMSAHAAST